MREEHAFLGEAIEGRRARVRIAEGASIGVAPVVTQDKENVWALRGMQSERGEQEQAECGG
jgi:hypothetical protein